MASDRAANSFACRLGRPRKTDLREVVNALLYIASSGAAWRLLPKDFSPFSTVQKYFYRWQDDGLQRTINNTLVMAAREQAQRQVSPTAGAIDSQSVKTTESGGIRGFDAGKKIGCVAIFSLLVIYVIISACN